MEVFNEKEVLRFLVTIRNSALPIETKAILRDLFLDYVATEEADKKKVISEMITNRLSEYPEFNLSGEATKNSRPLTKSKAQPIKTSLGQQRPSPSFTLNNKVVTGAIKTTEKIIDEAPLVSPKIAESNIPQEKDTVLKVSTPNNKERIAQIKHDINSIVGNPVNLISKDQEVGKEYMTALLEAMKKNSDTLSDDASMQRLETAYSAAKNILEQTKTDTITIPEKSPVATINRTESNQVQFSDANKTNTPSTKSSSQDTEPSVRQENPSNRKKFIPTRTEGLYHRPIDEVSETNNKRIKESTLNSLANNLWKKNEQKEVTESKPHISPQTQVSPSVRKVDVASDTPPSIDKPRTNVLKKPDQPLKSLKEETALPDRIEKLKNEAAARVEAAKQPITDLQSTAVEDGLKQLLSEWSLFRASGMFGTGPSGINHPLYKQLANLPMASVIAGRFEGASPVVKQQLTDYMNGWRYEQGIIHEMGETFDHYLRRVIRQILEHQRSNKV